MKKLNILIAVCGLALFSCKKQTTMPLETGMGSREQTGAKFALNGLGDPGTYINNSSTDVAGLLTSYDSTNPAFPRVVTPSVYEIGTGANRYHLLGIEVNASHGFKALKHYTSSDLTNWTDQGNLLDATVQVHDNRAGHTGELIDLPTSNAGRPKLFIQAAAGPQKYILLYKRAATEDPTDQHKDEAAIFTSANLTGPYVYSNVIRSANWVDGSGVSQVTDGLGNIGAYQEDGNGAAYLLYTFSTVNPPGTPNNNGRAIRRFNMATLSLGGSITAPADYRQVIVTTDRQEGGSIFKRAGYYYWVTSQTAGFNSSTTQYEAKTGTALLDNNSFSSIATMPTSPTWPFNPNIHSVATAKSFSYDTQQSCIIPIENAQTGTEYIYYGDRWTGYTDKAGNLSSHSCGGYSGSYPVIFLNNGSNAPIPVISAPNFDFDGGNWVPNTSTGKWDVFVQDGTFENAFATYWQVGGTTGIASVGAVGRSGKGLIVAGTASANTTVTLVDSLQLPTGTYSVSFWYKSPSALGNCAKTISVIKYSSAGAILSTSSVLNFPTTTTYQQKTVPTTVGVSIDVEAGEYLKIKVTNTGAGTIYLDDFTVTKM